MGKSEINENSPMFTFSVKEVISIFSGIDEQILQLHKCSSDDFLGLNADFKQYYRQSKVISENANEVFLSLTESESGNLLRKLEELYKELKVSQNVFSRNIESSITLLKELLVLLDKLFLPIKNLNQDLMTLKFLLANLKISSSSGSVVVQNLEVTIKDFNDVINSFKICSFQNESNLQGLKNQVKQTLQSFEGIRGRNIHDLDMILNQLHYGIIFFAEKHEEASRMIPELKQKTENSSKSIADIITNLQYQDIIRQKMEHIQATHKKVLSDLEEYSMDQTETLNQQHEKLVARIRDIANLQSAQLVHANKEYQQAIEIITEKFLVIGNEMTNISTMCLHFTASPDSTEEINLQSLLGKIENSSNVLSSFLEAGKSFTNHLDVLTSGIDSTGKGIVGFTKSLENLKGVTEKTLANFSSLNLKDVQLIETLHQIESLYEDVVNFEKTIQSIFTAIESKGANLSENIQNHLKSVKDKGTFAVSAESLNTVSAILAQKNERMQLLLNQNLDISKSISKDVRASIEKVRYYDFFEKIIVDIISELNQIYHKLKAEGKQVDEKSENLDSIKSLYTMASEHIIHDKIAANQGDVDLFEEEIPKVDEDDDNLELF